MEAEGRAFWDGQVGTFSFVLDLSAAMTLIRRVRKYIVHPMGSPGSVLKITARMLGNGIKTPEKDEESNTTLMFVSGVYMVPPWTCAD